MNALVRTAGFLTSVQDLGRLGYRQSGVSLGGALDTHAMRVANALAGNEDSAAGLEVTLGSVRIRFEDPRVVAWCGGGFAARIGEENLPPGHSGRIGKNEEIVMSAPKEGGRAWLAISGGIDVPMVLGSRSTDLRGNFGGFEGRALRDGDALPLGEPSDLSNRIGISLGNRRIAEWTAPSGWVTTAWRNPFLRVIRGPDWSRFTGDAHTSLVKELFTVQADSDRMAARLDGPELVLSEAGDLLSEAVAPGTLQVPPNGKPILLLGDCQTIGGYPKIAHVITVDLPFAAQLWAGDAVRFLEISLTDAQELVHQREADFARLRLGISLRVT